eukprot:364943-Chlamydomonas_euryale.AAC.25
MTVVCKCASHLVTRLNQPGPIRLIQKSCQPESIWLIQQKLPTENPSQKPTCTGALRRRGRPLKTHWAAGTAAPCRELAYGGHAVPRLCRPSASLCSARDQQLHGPAAAVPRQRPQCLLAPGHRHGQITGWHPLPDSSDVRGGGSGPTHADPERGEARAPRTCGQDA